MKVASAPRHQEADRDPYLEDRDLEVTENLRKRLRLTRVPCHRHLWTAKKRCDRSNFRQIGFAKTDSGLRAKACQACKGTSDSVRGEVVGMDVL